MDLCDFLKKLSILGDYFEVDIKKDVDIYNIAKFYVKWSSGFIVVSKKPVLKLQNALLETK